MGDRGNICVKNGSDRVYLYTHWHGCELPMILQKALRKGVNWGDPQYLARTIFCEMISNDKDSDNGFGISSTLTDNEHPIIYVTDEDVEILGTRWTYEQYIDPNQLNKILDIYESDFNEFDD